MLFRSHKREPSGPVGPVAHQATPADPPRVETDELERRRVFEQWRRCEQRVRQAWKAWQAADRGEDAVYYHAFMSALAEEEAAATEVQRQAVSSRG